MPRMSSPPTFDEMYEDTFWDIIIVFVLANVTIAALATLVFGYSVLTVIISVALTSLALGWFARPHLTTFFNIGRVLYGHRETKQSEPIET